jgi:hypothetical protein
MKARAAAPAGTPYASQILVLLRNHQPRAPLP